MTYWRDLDVTAVDDSEATDATDSAETGPTEPVVPETVAQDDAETAMAEAAHPVLTAVAGSYHGLITHTELALRLKSITGLNTKSNPNLWMSRVLAKAAALDLEAGRPPLTALVVDKTDGTVGAPYVELLELRGSKPIADELTREKHAAAARMDCYRWAGASMPAGGGNPGLSPRYDMVVTRDRRKARQEAEPTVCPTCFMAIPPTGVCDNCG